MPDKL